MSALFVRLQYLLPHHLLCRIVHALSRSRIRWLKNSLIDAFMRAYRPHMADALEPEPLRYPSFNAFFTRALRADARPIDPDPRRVVSPCDGTLSIASALDGNELLQAKGHAFSLEALLGDDGPTGGYFHRSASCSSFSRIRSRSSTGSCPRTTRGGLDMSRRAYSSPAIPRQTCQRGNSCP